VVIPQGVTSIDKIAFAECSSLTSVAIPQGVTFIGKYAFAGCTSLASIVISTNSEEEYNRILQILPDELKGIAKNTHQFIEKGVLVKESVKYPGFFEDMLPEITTKIIAKLAEVHSQGEINEGALARAINSGRNANK
jgi:hypothetical protein